MQDLIFFQSCRAIEQYSIVCPQHPANHMTGVVMQGSPKRLLWRPSLGSPFGGMYSIITNHFQLFTFYSAPGIIRGTLNLRVPFISVPRIHYAW